MGKRTRNINFWYASTTILLTFKNSILKLISCPLWSICNLFYILLSAGGAANSAGGNKVNALFGERKSNNLFNGIWRFPNSEFDRAGNFSTHMGKCTTTLLEMALQLKDAQVDIETNT